jgi:phosphoribosylformylglycinamidine synthase PurS subunit
VSWLVVLALVLNKNAGSGGFFFSSPGIPLLYITFNDSFTRRRKLKKVKVTVFVTPKSSVLDPQGAAVNQAMHSLGFKGSSNVRIGKLISFNLDEEDSADLRVRLEKICEGLLSNPVIEDYSYEVSSAS